MRTKAFFSPVVLLALILVIPSGCKKNPTTTELPSQQQAISVVINPNSAGADTVVTISIIIQGNTKEIRVFGLDVAFDAKMFAFQGVVKGDITGSWASVDGNELSPGELKIGGYVGSGTPVPAKGQGKLAEFKLKVTGQDYANGQQSQVSIKQYTDDITGFRPEPASVAFTLKK
jgi:hypothetical protein